MCIGLLLVCIFYQPFSSSLSDDLLAVLDPRRKLSYFKKAGWDEEWVDPSADMKVSWLDAAREIVENEFLRNYASYSRRPDRDERMDTPQKPHYVRNIISNMHLI